MTYNIALIKGDGIGPEITAAAVRVLGLIGKKYGHDFNFHEAAAGGRAIDEHGIPLPPQTIDICKKSDAVLLGAVGGPKWDTLPGHLRPERALLGLRKELGLFANLRPAALYPSLSAACPLRADIAAAGIDMVIVRELTGGMYYGDRGRRMSEGGEEAYDTECYSASEIERIGRTAFELASKRQNRLVSIDKANVLESSRLWREVIHALSAQYPQVELTDMLVDNAAMQLIRNPAQFDVIVTGNMFGDILSDEASMLTGSIGLLPSASVGAGRGGLFEPIHGSAPDIAGQNKANPIATILSAAMMLRYAFGLDREAGAVEDAVSGVLLEGARTADILGAGSGPALTTDAMTDAILAKI
ncbi:MAG: 3-isopropylmalate dehydrogenase [Eubacteriales bacterium]|nr:3-isopropylmalate dehydrogenase [Eubacteriales bacterium]